MVRHHFDPYRGSVSLFAIAKRVTIKLMGFLSLVMLFSDLEISKNLELGSNK
jgi:hypothetical protein